MCIKLLRTESIWVKSYVFRQLTIITLVSEVPRNSVMEGPPVPGRLTAWGLGYSGMPSLLAGVVVVM